MTQSPSLLSLLIPLALVYLGCIANSWTLEVLVRYDPSSGDVIGLDVLSTDSLYFRWPFYPLNDCVSLTHPLGRASFPKVPCGSFFYFAVGDVITCIQFFFTAFVALFSNLQVAFCLYGIECALSSVCQCLWTSFCKFLFFLIFAYFLLSRRNQTPPLCSHIVWLRGDIP